MILVDGSNCLHRSLHVPSLWELKTVTGRHTGAIHGFLISISSLAKKYKLQRGIFVAWDLGSSTQRLAIYPKYKEGRLNREDPLQLEKLAEEKREINANYIWSRKFLHKIVLPMSGCLTTQVQGIEADDIIAWVVRLFKGTEQRITIVSTDHDFYQLISDTVEVWDPIRRVLYDKDAFIEKYNLLPDKYVEQWLLIRAMLGDSSDRIPGVKGIGEKYASEISRIVLTEGEEALDMTKVRNRKYLESKEDLRRNIRLMDLNHGEWPENDAIIEQAVKISCSLRMPLDSEIALHTKLAQLELTKAREVIPDIMQANDQSQFKDTILERMS